MKRIVAWLPVLVWMVTIFLLSSRSSVQISHKDTINFLFFKTIHVIEYAILYFFAYRAVRFETQGAAYPYSFFLAYILCVLYASSDEIHQTMVPTREGHPRDVIIDTVGILLSWILIRQLFPHLPKRLKTLGDKWLTVK